MSSFAKKRRLNTFNADLQKEFPYFNVGSSVRDIICQKCFSRVSTATMGKSAILQHLEQDKYKKAVDVPASAPMSTFFRREQFGESERKLAAAEGTFTNHTVRHLMSFRSMDCYYC